MAEANAARDAGSWEEAAELYRLAHRRKPHLRYLQNERAATLWQAGRLTEALDMLVEHLRTAAGTDAAEAHAALADFWAATRNVAAAEFHHARAAAAGRPSGLIAFRNGRMSPRRRGEGGAEIRDGNSVSAALAACEAEPGNVHLLRRAADRLAADGANAEADLLADLAALRAGTAPAAGSDPEASKDGQLILAGVRRDLRRLLDVLMADPAAPDDPALFFPPPEPRRADVAQLVTRDAFADVKRRLRRLQHLLSDSVPVEELAAFLDELGREVLLKPPLGYVDGIEPDRSRLVARTVWNGLRDLLLRHRYLAYPPSGSAALFRASAAFDRSGLGPFLDGASRFVEHPADVFALTQLAFGDDECPATLAERGAMLLGVHLGPARTNELVEELGDYGFTRAVAAIAAQRVADADQDRHLGVVVRDAFLSSGETALARAAQAGVAAAWPDNRDEQNVLREMEGLVERGMNQADRDRLEARFSQDARRARLRTSRLERTRRSLDFRQEAEEFAALSTTLLLAPELAIERPSGDVSGDAMEVMHLGWFKRPSPWGMVPVLRGIEAIRVACTGRDQAIRLRVGLDGRPVADLSITKPAPADASGRSRVVFNAWLDVTKDEVGSHLIEIVVTDAAGNRTVRRERVLVDCPAASDRFALSDATIVLDDPVGDGSLDDRINALPSMVRQAGRSLFGTPPRRVLVVRADQLGDFVTSIPAIRRLRELLPRAELHALVTPGNAELARSLGLFTGIFTVELTYSHATKRRHLAIDKQESLRERLGAEGFELAIDLSPGHDSRPLLRLSGAPHLVGFKPAEFPWLTLGIDMRTHDPVNGKERASHATQVLSLVDALGAALAHRSVVVPNPNASRADLARFEIAPGQSFVVLHSGARIDFKRWPFGHYLDLARLIVERTDRKVILLADDAMHAGLVSASGLPSDRLRFEGGMVANPELEALLAFCDAFVGNDTGPKHLAALRGAKVISVHMGQVNWDEWGQEGEGLIVSRRVPCCGCGIDRAENCGKDLACLVHIPPDEVFEALTRVLNGRPT